MFCCEASDTEHVLEKIPEVTFADVKRLDISFKGAGSDGLDREVQGTSLTPEGRQNLIKVAEALRDFQELRVKIKSFCGIPVSPRMIILARQRTFLVHEFLMECGCKANFVIAPVGIGIKDEKGPRCEIEICPVQQDSARMQHEERFIPAVSEEKEMAAPYLSISFSMRRSTETSQVTKTWFNRPLGFTYSTDVLPIRVTKVVTGSAADTLGVQRGMEIRAIHFTGESQVDCRNGTFEDVHDLLTMGTQLLPHASDRPWLTLFLYDPARPGKLQSRTWYTKPLGLTCSIDESPVRIDRVIMGSRAWELGVKIGMQIRGVEFMGQTALDVTGKAYSETYDLIARGMKGLADAA